MESLAGTPAGRALVIVLASATIGLVVNAWSPKAIPYIAPAPVQRTRLESMVTDLVEGVRYAFLKHQLILELIITAAIYSFGMSAFSTLFPILGKNLLGLGPAEIGYLWSSLGIGLFAVSVALLRMSDWHVRERMQAIAVSSIVTGLALCALVGTSNRVVAGVLLLLVLVTRPLGNTDQLGPRDPRATPFILGAAPANGLHAGDRPPELQEAPPTSQHTDARPLAIVGIAALGAALAFVIVIPRWVGFAGPHGRAVWRARCPAPAASSHSVQQGRVQRGLGRRSGVRGGSTAARRSSRRP